MRASCLEQNHSPLFPPINSPSHFICNVIQFLFAPSSSFPTETILGLDPPAAEHLWHEQLASSTVKKDQVNARSRDGKDIGKAVKWRGGVRCLSSTVSTFNRFNRMKVCVYYMPFMFSFLLQSLSTVTTFFVSVLLFPGVAYLDSSGGWVFIIYVSGLVGTGGWRFVTSECAGGSDNDQLLGTLLVESIVVLVLGQLVLYLYISESCF